MPLEDATSEAHPTIPAISFVVLQFVHGFGKVLIFDVERTLLVVTVLGSMGVEVDATLGEEGVAAKGELDFLLGV